MGVTQGQLGATEDDQRAWVAADISINGDLKVNESGAVVALKYVLKNDGRTPAVKRLKLQIILPELNLFRKLTGGL